MKARVLRKLLNDTLYTISNHRDYIAIGSPMCHDLISVKKNSLSIRYALDTFNEGRKCLEGKLNTELLFIWDKLHELAESGELLDIINGKDVIENPLPVFTVNNDGELVESLTDKYGWPNTDDNGIMMYDNTHFKTKDEALDYGIKDNTSGLKITERRIKEINADLRKIKRKGSLFRARILKLKRLKDNTAND